MEWNSPIARDFYLFIFQELAILILNNCLFWIAHINIYIFLVHKNVKKNNNTP